MFEKAEIVELKRKFKPFLKDGEAVRAALTDEVDTVPPEEWPEPKVPFPTIKDVSSLRIT